MSKRTQQIRQAFAALALTGTLLVPGVLLAQAAAPVGPTMGFGEIVNHLTQQGIQNIREIELKSERLYEVKAQDAEGRWVELYVDSRSGEVLKQEVRRGERHRTGGMQEGSGSMRGERHRSGAIHEDGELMRSGPRMHNS